MYLSTRECVRYIVEFTIGATVETISFAASQNVYFLAKCVSNSRICSNSKMAIKALISWFIIK